MALSIVLLLCTIAIFLIQLLFSPIPLASDRAEPRRIPIITIAIVIVNAAVFAVTFHSVELDDELLIDSKVRLLSFLEKEPTLLELQDVQSKLIEAELVSDGKLLTLNREFRLVPPNDARVIRSFGEARTRELRSELETLLQSYEAVVKTHVFYRYGLSANGKWKSYQLLTCMFLHDGIWHILGNMVFFAALSISLEALWGRSIFLVFYLLAGVAACLPGIISPMSAPMVGASGAISGVMGGFLISLARTKLKIGWLSIPGIPIFLILRRKPFGVLRVPAYIFLPYYFVEQMLMWWFFKEYELASGVAYSVHIAGFFFGMLFAVLIEGANLKLSFFDVSYSESLVAAEVRELVEKGRCTQAEQRIKLFLERKPDDLDAVKALIPVYRRMCSYHEFNATYSRLICHYFSTGDKQTAAAFYQSLVAELPGNLVRPEIPLNDWVTICDYIYRTGNLYGAALEYERLADACPGSPLAVRALVSGAEAALGGRDVDRARRLFERALAIQPSPAFEVRIRRGIGICDDVVARTQATSHLTPRGGW